MSSKSQFSSDKYFPNSSKLILKKNGSDKIYLILLIFSDKIWKVILKSVVKISFCQTESWKFYWYSSFSGKRMSNTFL